jgi:glyceraldehyde 3-phosphate dehydrogenase
MAKHLDAGAARVLLSAPAKDDTPVSVYGVDHERHRGAQLLSAASCTTNCTAPVMDVLANHLGVRKATLTTTHAYTAGQELVDGPASKWRRGRAASANIVPTTTGAAKATGKVVPAVDGVFDGVALRVPVAVGSVSDIVCVTERRTSVEEINELFRQEAGTDRYRGVLGISDDPIVSADIVRDGHASLVDLTMTQVVDGDLLKVMSWYDNEWGYAKQMVRLAGAMVAEPAPVAS